MTMLRRFSVSKMRFQRRSSAAVSSLFPLLPSIEPRSSCTIWRACATPARIPRTPTFVDSPMALAALRIYEESIARGSPEIRADIAHAKSFFNDQDLTEIKTVEESIRAELDVGADDHHLRVGNGVGRPRPPSSQKTASRPPQHGDSCRVSGRGNSRQVAARRRSDGEDAGRLRPGRRGNCRCPRLLRRMPIRGKSSTG